MLILDEPANGLDPEGMRWMRGLLRDFADRGGTVLLSSHLLAEVEAVADQLVIIGGGRIAAQGAREELLAATGTLVRATDDDALAGALAAAELTAVPAADGGYVVDAEPEAVGLAALRRRRRAHAPGARRGRRPGAAVLRAHRHRGGDRMNSRPGIARLTWSSCAR